MYPSTHSSTALSVSEHSLRPHFPQLQTHTQSISLKIISLCNSSRMSVSKTVLSIDIGLLNLAMCVLELTSELSQPTIVYWKVIDVVSDTPQATHPCQCTVKDRPCKRIAKWTSDEWFFCTQHKPKDATMVPKAVKTKVKDINPQKVCWNLLTTLESIKDILPRVTHIVIEKQPLENKKMQMASHFIFTWFVQLYQNKVPITLLPAYHKLKHFPGPEIDCALKSKYAQRKYIGVQQTRWYLSHSIANGHEHSTTFEQQKKKDDLADALLQALYFIGKTKPHKRSQGPYVKRRRRKKLHY